jgi:anti-sigma factor RsiW
MKCSQARKFLSAFQDNELDVRTNIELLEHIEMCDRCRARLETERRLKEAVAGHLDSIVAPDYLRARIAEKLRAVPGRNVLVMWREAARSPWFRVVTAAASIFIVFTLVYWVVLAPEAALNDDAVGSHVAVLRNQVPSFYLTDDAERAKRLALFKLGEKPSVPLIGDSQFELVGAGPAEIQTRDVGHFVFRYKAATVSMFVFKGLSLDEVGGTAVTTRFGSSKLSSRGGIALLSWQAEDFTYILVSQTSTQELLNLVGPTPDAR